MDGFKTAVARIGAVDMTQGAIFEIKDGKDTIRQAVMPRGWMRLAAGDHYLVKYVIGHSDGFKTVSIQCLYQCDSSGNPLYGALTPEQIEAAPVLTITEKSERGIRIKRPDPWKRTVVTDYFKPDGWERTAPGETLSGWVDGGNFRLNPIQ